MDLQIFPPDTNRPIAAVISHERSGTHFLISSLSGAFGYMPVDNRLDLDVYTIQMNFFAPQDVSGFFDQITAHKVANVLKSHHSSDFFEPIIEEILEHTAIFYIYRHPRDVMHSLWRMLKNLPWREGPNCPTPADLMRAQPEGHLMRYQMKQADSMLHRWDAHVNGWLDLADQYGSRGKGIHIVRYEDLRDDYASTMSKLGESAIGEPPTSLSPPDKNAGVVIPQALDSTKVEWEAQDLEHIETVCAETLKRLGYT